MSCYKSVHYVDISKFGYFKLIANKSLKRKEINGKKGGVVVRTTVLRSYLGGHCTLSQLRG